jgi:hypothetical protein
VTTEQPIEARCDHCRQTRPLFRYEPDHGMHLGALAFSCRWCTRDEQPLLCARCWSTEKEREETHPDLIEEAEQWARICEANEIAAARRAA